MKKVLLVVVILSCMTTMGCQATVTPDNIKALSEQVDNLAKQVDVYQAAIDEITANAATTGLITAEQKAKVDAYQAKIDAAKPIITAANAAIKNADYDPTGDTVKTLLTALQAVNAASAPVNPYSGMIAAILALITLISGAFAVKKTSDANAATATAVTKTEEAKVATAKYTAHKQGVELTMKQMSASAVPEVKALEAELYQNIGDARIANGVTAA